MNEFKKRFGFTLRVTKNPTASRPCIPYDPVGNNQNGDDDGGFVGPDTLTLAAVVVGVAAVAYIAYRAFW